jgi:release factor glutamine methyltransferase
MNTLTVGEVLGLSTRYLGERGSESPRLDAELLVSTALGIRRLDLYLAPERPLTLPERDRLRELVRRRGQGEPVAYIRGTRDFHGLSIQVTPDVLIPRPETEAIVDAALEWLGNREGDDLLVADVCTGSGAIACAIAAACPRARIVATDISAEALAVAARNVSAHGFESRIRLEQCDLLDAVPGRTLFDAVVANPPYVAETERGLMDPGVLAFEPGLALFSGEDGTDASFRLIDQAAPLLRDGGILIVEIGTSAQGDRVFARMGEMFSPDAVQPVRDVARVVRGYQARKNSGIA